MTDIPGILTAAALIGVAAYCFAEQRRIDRERRAERRPEPPRTDTPWGEVIELHPEAKRFHSRRNSL